MSIRDNWLAFQEQLEKTAQTYGRDPSSIKVMAVSKTRNIEEIVEARNAGLDLFGENRVEEASGKFASLERSQFPLYLIGHLQSNKAVRIDSRYAGVHSVDSVKIASRLSLIRTKINEPLEVLLQVNTSGEDSKSGFEDPNLLAEAAAEISEMPNLVLRGVMTMAPFVEDEEVVRRCFSLCRDWCRRIEHSISGKPVLSMGMSSDFQWAVAEGSSLLRIGTTIFGGRQ